MKSPLSKPLVCAALHQIWLVSFPLLYCRSLFNVMTTLGSFWDGALFTWLHRTSWCSIPPSLPPALQREKSHADNLTQHSADRALEHQKMDKMPCCTSFSLSISLSLVTCCAPVPLNVCPSHRSKSGSPAPQLHGQTVQINPVTAGVNNTGIFSHLG